MIHSRNPSYPSRRQVLTAAGALALLPAVPAQAAPENRTRPRRPTVVAFDVIETLFDLAPLQNQLRDAGLPAGVLGEWFARMLRDAMALTVTGGYRSFRDVAAGTLREMLVEAKVDTTTDRIDAVLAGFAELPAHPDVAPAFERLRAARVRVITLTNGSAENTRRLLARAKLDGLVERSVSVDEVRWWKPAREVYLHTAKVAGVEPVRMALVAAHDWDCHGAARAGLATGFVARGGRGFHAAMDPPDVRGPTLTAVVDGLLALPAAEGKQ